MALPFAIPSVNMLKTIRSNCKFYIRLDASLHRHRYFPALLKFIMAQASILLPCQLLNMFLTLSWLFHMVNLKAFHFTSMEIAGFLVCSRQCGHFRELITNQHYAKQYTPHPSFRPKTILLNCNFVTTGEALAKFVSKIYLYYQNY